VISGATVALREPVELSSQIDASTPLFVQKSGTGLSGSGLLLREQFSGTGMFTDASEWWQALARSSRVVDSVARPGSGLVGFVRFPFSPQSSRPAEVLIPQRVVGSDSHGQWESDFGESEHHSAVDTSTRLNSGTLRWSQSPTATDLYRQACSQALQEIHSGNLEKVVIARLLEAQVQGELDIGIVLRQLLENYPDTHVFAIDDFFGASPETLLSVSNGRASLRVLAGSAPRGSSPEQDLAISRNLALSTKDLDEHHFAVSSVVDSLGLDENQLVIGDTRTIKLKNVWHLATDMMFTMPPGESPLSIVGRLHPTAAVAGTPRDSALELINRLEGFDRGYFTGPVGWVDSAGNGEFAIALRCAHIERATGRLLAYAGAGIVKESQVESEWLETELKMLPIREALSRI
jgi:menaquinone-specific isochorismate synthase